MWQYYTTCVYNSLSADKNLQFIRFTLSAFRELMSVNVYTFDFEDEIDI